MRYKYTYEILLTETNVDEKSWLEFIFSISKINGWLKPFKIYISINTNEIKFFLKTKLKMPPAIGNLGYFLLKPCNTFKVPKAKFRFFYYLSTKFPSVLDIFDRNESKYRRKLELTEITFLSFKRDNFLNKTKLYFRKENEKLIFKYGLLNIPHTFLALNFDKHTRFFYQKDAIKYLDIRKSLHILNQDKKNSIFKVDTFPYLPDDYYLNITNFDFDKHSIVIGSSGSGKSKFISSFVSKVMNNINYRENYKFVIIDPHASLKSDIGGIDNTSILDFKSIETSVDLLSNSTNDKVTSTELLMSLFQNLMGDLFNSRLERVLRHSIHLLLLDDNLNFTNLRKLILDINFRNNLLKNSTVIPESIIDFFSSDFNELKTKSYSEAIAPIIAFIDEMQLIPSFNYEGKQENLKNIIKNNSISLFSLDQTKLGEKVTKTISGLIMQQLLQLVQSHSFEEHIIFIIDEIAVVENPIVKRFLSEARKYNLSIMLSGQYFNQISDDLQKAIFANVINYYIFRIARQDAICLESNIQMEIGVRNSYVIRIKLLNELNNRECIARVSKDGIILPAFKATTTNFIPIPPKTINQILRTKMLTKEFKKEIPKNKISKFNLGERVSIESLMASQSSSRRVLNNNG
ncbi:MAG: DUF87 domain-containing protein [Clostridia bacterium]|nr:DUF87 domain-containing protein [Clostridia bacterium]